MGILAVGFEPRGADHEPELLILSAAERERYERIPVATRDLFLSGRLLLRRMLADQLGIAPVEVPLIAVCPECGGPHGRPIVDGSDLRVSLSRCALGVAAVIARGAAVGIDIEPMVGTPERMAAIRATVDAVGAGGMERWTRVEATLKADGRGIRVDPAAVRVERGEHGWESAIDGSPVRYRIVEPAPDHRIRISVAVAIAG